MGHAKELILKTAQKRVLDSLDGEKHPELLKASFYLGGFIPEVIDYDSAFYACPEYRS